MQPGMRIWYRRMTAAGGRFSWESGLSPIPCGIIWAERLFWRPCHGRTDGWPVIGNGGRIEPVMEAPQLPEVRWPHKAIRDDFDEYNARL